MSQVAAQSSHHVAPLDVVPVSSWSKDHWSLLAYVETRVVDHNGKLNIQQLRCNPARHPLNQHNGGWRLEYSSRLMGYFDAKLSAEESIAKNLQVSGHDDWDCLNDFEAAGYLEVISLVNGFVSLTEKGHEVAARLRVHKAAGGMFATFIEEAVPA